MHKEQYKRFHIPTTHKNQHIENYYAIHCLSINQSVSCYQRRKSHYNFPSRYTPTPCLWNQKWWLILLHTWLYPTQEMMVPRPNRSGSKLPRIRFGWQYADNHYHSCFTTMERITSSSPVTDKSTTQAISQFRNTAEWITSTITLPMASRQSDNAHFTRRGEHGNQVGESIPRFMGICSELSLSPPVVIRAKNLRKSRKSNSVDRKGLRC
jgi:hypothetical protein